MNNLESILGRPEVFIPFMIWSLIWKGLALWKAANKRQLLWFVLVLVLNTLSILEIGYVLFFHQKDIDNGKVLNYLQKKMKLLTKKRV